MNSTDTQIEKLEANLRALERAHAGFAVQRDFAVSVDAAPGPGNGGEIRAEDSTVRPCRGGISRADHLVLPARGVAHPSDLCARAAQSPANMSRISDALVSRNLITRVLSVQDRRRMVLRITEEGEDLVRRLLPTMFVSLRGMLAEFSESEQDQLICAAQAPAPQLRGCSPAGRSPEAKCAGAGAMRRVGDPSCRVTALALRRLRGAAAETGTGATVRRRAVGRSRGPVRRRLARAGMVEALSRSDSRWLDRTGGGLLADSGHGSRPLRFRAPVGARSQARPRGCAWTPTPTWVVSA